MASRHWSQKILTTIAAGAAAGIVAVGTAPPAGADDAALAGWLTKAFDPIQQLHTAENALVPLLAVDSSESEMPVEDVDALKQPCDQLKAPGETLQRLLPTPDAGLTTEVQQAVDGIDTAVEGCATVIGGNITDRVQAARAILGPLYGAESHLASADIILAKLSAPK